MTVEPVTDGRQLNADRFAGFAEIYDSARPSCPSKVRDIALRYLGRRPTAVVDIGCGTGLSTGIWSDVCKVVGVDPSADMLRVARSKLAALGNVTFIQGFSDNTGLLGGCADVVTCSQSFHWMNPTPTLREVGRVLRAGGVFAAYDCDWPPVCHCDVELAYNRLSAKVTEIEASHQSLRNACVRWDKGQHLANIGSSGVFRYVREVVFANSEACTARRFLSLALSQGGLQAAIRAGVGGYETCLAGLREALLDTYGDDEFEVDFCYRMRIGVK